MVEFISDLDGFQYNINKVFKILDWPKYVDIIITWAFISIYVYYWIWIKAFAQVAIPIYRLFKKNAAFE